MDDLTQRIKQAGRERADAWENLLKAEAEERAARERYSEALDEHWRKLAAFNELTAQIPSGDEFMAQMSANDMVSGG
jgi:hypothetical protein